MVASINSITTNTPEWQKKCWGWAEARTVFEVRDMQAPHFLFCQELCGEYNYTYQYRCNRSESVAKFTPIE
jgi:hypothetical protein